MCVCVREHTRKHTGTAGVGWFLSLKQKPSEIMHVAWSDHRWCPVSVTNLKKDMKHIQRK